MLPNAGGFGADDDMDIDLDSSDEMDIDTFDVDSMDIDSVFLPVENLSPQTSKPSLPFLPTEILLHIFRFLVPSKHSERRTRKCINHWIDYFENRLPFYITSICRRWRAISLSTHSLWSTWYIDVGDPSVHVVTFLRRFVSRALAWSGNSLLNFGLEFRHTGTAGRTYMSYCSKVLWDVVGALSAHQARWEQVDFELHDIRRSTGSLTIRWNDWRNLREFNLNASCRVGISPWPPSSNRTSVFPCMRQVSLQHPSRDALHALKDLFCRSEGLNNLTLDLSKASRDSLDTKARRSVGGVDMLTAKGLRNLEVITQWVYGPSHMLRVPPPPEDILESLTCPSLDTFKIDTSFSSTIYAIADFMRRSSSPLTHLLIQFTDSYLSQNFDHGLRALLREIPTLLSLSVHGYRDELALTITSLASIKGDSFEVVPKLEEIEFSDICMNRDSLTRMLNRRWRAPVRTIRSAKLYSCSDSGPLSWPFPPSNSGFFAFDRAFWADIIPLQAEGLAFQSVMQPHGE